MFAEETSSTVSHTVHSIPLPPPHHLLSDDTHTELDNDIAGVLFMTTIALVLVD